MHLKKQHANTLQYICIKATVLLKLLHYFPDVDHYLWIWLIALEWFNLKALVATTFDLFTFTCYRKKVKQSL